MLFGAEVEGKLIRMLSLKGISGHAFHFWSHATARWIRIHSGRIWKLN